jgi:hypothetical protein
VAGEPEPSLGFGVRSLFSVFLDDKEFSFELCPGKIQRGSGDTIPSSGVSEVAPESYRVGPYS